MSFGRLTPMIKTRHNVLKCRHVDEHNRALLLHPRECCFKFDICLLACRANLSYDGNEGHDSSAASAAFLEKVSNLSCLG